MEHIRKILKDSFGLSADHIVPLVGEVNKNYLVEQGSRKYIFKETPVKEEDNSFSQDESELLDHLSSALPGFCYPFPLFYCYFFRPRSS